MKIGFVSLGCPKNQLDTEVMLHEVAEAGYELTAEETEADIVIINTCAFIESAKKESIENILDIAWLKEHHTLKGIIVTGCLAERYRDQIFEELPEVDAVLGVGSIHNIVEAIKAVEARQRYFSYLPNDEVELGGSRVLKLPRAATTVAPIVLSPLSAVASVRVLWTSSLKKRRCLSARESGRSVSWRRTSPVTDQIFTESTALRLSSSGSRLKRTSNGSACSTAILTKLRTS